MRVGRTSICVLLAAVLVSGSALLDTASAQQQHITATVTGAKIQKVGFRASARRQGPDRSDSRCHSRRQQEILAQQYNRSGPSPMRPQSEDVHDFRLDIDRPENYEPL